MKLLTTIKTVGQDVRAVSMRLSILLFALLANSAFAQEVNLIDGNTPIVKLACGVFNALSGPAAFLIGLIVVVVGGISIAIGGKRVIGGVVWGIVGVGLAISASQIVKAIMPGETALCGVV